MNHPDRQFVSDLVHDLQFGCRLGYRGPRYHRITPNLKSTLLHPNAVTEALMKEMFRFRQLAPQADLEPTTMPPSAPTLWQVA